MGGCRPSNYISNNMGVCTVGGRVSPRCGDAPCSLQTEISLQLQSSCWQSLQTHRETPRSCSETSMDTHGFPQASLETVHNQSLFVVTAWGSARPVTSNEVPVSKLLMCLIDKGGITHTLWWLVVVISFTLSNGLSIPVKQGWLEAFYKHW